jgi:laminin G domain protein
MRRIMKAMGAVVVGAAVEMLAVGVLLPTPAHAAANITIANWQMNEGSGATVMLDSSGNGINGSIGSAVQTNFHFNGATGYHWVFTSPTNPPPKPERLVTVPDSRLNPGTGDYAVTMRFRTSKTFGNIIQKGQAGATGGYFKWEIPKGFLKCVFRGVNSSGNFIRKEVNSPTKLNNNAWHTVRCERTSTKVTMTIDGSTTVQANGQSGSISNNVPLTIAGKSNCDQQSITCDYFTGDIDWVKIERS